jgi:hypothetical protein
MALRSARLNASLSAKRRGRSNLDATPAMRAGSNRIRTPIPVRLDKSASCQSRRVRAGPIGRHEPEHERISKKFLARTFLLRLKFRFLKPRSPRGWFCDRPFLYSGAARRRAASVLIRRSLDSSARCGHEHVSSLIGYQAISRCSQDGLSDVAFIHANRIPSARPLKVLFLTQSVL